MKKIISMTVAATLVMSSVMSTAVFATEMVAVKGARIDALAAATGTTTAPAPKPAAPKPAAPKPSVSKPVAKPTASPAATATEISRLLAVGSKGADVTLLQTKLNSNGFKLVVDGIYGMKTAEAVKAFQGKNGLKADGIVGPKTTTILMPVVAATPATPAVPATPVTPATPAAPTTSKAPGIYPDIVASASVILTTEKELQNSLGEKGTWITTVGSDVTVANDLVWTGDVRKEGATAPARKLGIYYHSTPNIGGEQVFTLKVPNLIVKAENANIAYGTLDGNVKVEAKGFKLTNATITGNLEFASQEQYDSSSYNEVVIKGDVIVAGNKLSSKDKPQTVTNYGKYEEAASKGDMMKVAVTFKGGKAHDVLIDVFGPAYFMKQGILSSGAQGNWGKVAYAKAGQYTMVKPSADRPADTILSWDKQIAEVIKLYKKVGYDMNQIPTVQRDATHPSVLDFNKLFDGKYKAYTMSETNGAIDGAKLKGAERSAAAKADAITSCSVDVGKYLKLADDIIKAGTK